MKRVILFMLNIFLTLGLPLMVNGIADNIERETSTAFEYRCWQFHWDNWDYLKDAIPQAKNAGMNRIQLSHDIISNAEELWKGRDAVKKLELIKKCVALAHENDLKVDMWTHEFSGVPDEFIENDNLMVQPKLWKWLQNKYQKLFNLVPDIDGIVLTFSETDYEIYKDEKICKQETIPLFVQMVELLVQICDDRGKDLIIRTFVHRPGELELIERAMWNISSKFKNQDNLIVMSKIVPHDWHPYFPYNPLLGNVGELPQVVELDLGNEYLGKSWIPNCMVDYVRMSLAHAGKKNVIGAVARIERHDNLALGTPNEVNIYAYNRLLNEPQMIEKDRDKLVVMSELVPYDWEPSYNRLLKDPGRIDDKLWREWAIERYGKKASPYIIDALKRTSKITNIIFYPLEQWIMDHSEIPSWDYAYRHITDYKGYSVKSWAYSPHNEHLHELLLHPDENTFIKIEQEKALARKLNEYSMNDLDKAKPYLKTMDYRELRHYLELQRINIDIFEHVAQSFFKSLPILNPDGEMDISDEWRKKLKNDLRLHMKKLGDLSDEIESKFGLDVHPGNPERIRTFIMNIRKKCKL